MAVETSMNQEDSLDSVFGDPTPEELGTLSDQQPDGSATGSQEPTSPQNEFEGLPFQDLTALKAGYKELQRAYTQERIGSLEMSRRLKELETRTREVVPTTKAEAVAQTDTLERIKALLQDPDAVLEEKIKPLRDNVKTLMDENTALKRKDELSGFYKDVEDAGFGKLTDEDEEALVLIIRENDWMANIPVKARLTTALNMLLRKEPTRFTNRTTPATPSKDLANAKRAAGIAPKGGSKGASGVKDEMDEVLEYDRADKAKW